jgi:hypothetical protein
MVTVDLNTLDGMTLVSMRPIGTYYSWENYKSGGIGYNDSGYHIEYKDSNGVQQIFPLPYATRYAAIMKLDDLTAIKPTIAQRLSSEVHTATTSLLSPISDAVSGIGQTVVGTTNAGVANEVGALWNSIKWYIFIIVVAVAAFILLAVRINRPSITVGRMG